MDKRPVFFSARRYNDSRYEKCSSYIGGHRCLRCSLALLPCVAYGRVNGVVPLGLNEQTPLIGQNFADAVAAAAAAAAGASGLHGLLTFLRAEALYVG